MKLLNPKDDELNAAFAEKVAGLANISDWGAAGWHARDPKEGTRSPMRAIPDYVASTDAVLPWLEKHQWLSERFEPGPHNHTYQVWLGESPWDKSGGGPTLAKAAVVALLRANGVDVEFA